ncbi:MAG: restriction endonuclease [Gammaproteobacteria bacterium]|nr:restriction endonuclease [Gammaproteobacteria bacterium]
MTIYAIKGSKDKDQIAKVFKSLKQGEGRYGWSYVETANLRDLNNRIEQDGWESLSEEEKDCYSEFLLGMQPGDYVVYINVPEWGKCTLAKVTGQYEWRFDDDDFNHRFPVDSESIRVFNRNDRIVPPPLRSRLSLQGRWWTIYTEEEFNELLNYLEAATPFEPSTSETNLRYLSEKIEPHLLDITNKIHKAHPNKKLEDLVAMVFRKIPGVTDVRQLKGRADRGADLLVDIESIPIPGLIRQETLAVQVKSWEGEHSDPSAVNDIRRAFKNYEKDENISMGLIISTATEAGDRLITELDKLREESGKPVALLLGIEFAIFVLTYAGDILLDS